MTACRWKTVPGDLLIKGLALLGDVDQLRQLRALHLVANKMRGYMSLAPLHNFVFQQVRREWGSRGSFSLNQSAKHSSLLRKY